MNTRFGIVSFLFFFFCRLIFASPFCFFNDTSFSWECSCIRSSFPFACLVRLYFCFCVYTRVGPTWPCSIFAFAELGRWRCRALLADRCAEPGRGGGLHAS